MFKKIIIITITFFILINAASAMDTSNWTTATVGYEEFKIPPQYENPYSSDFHMYEYDEDIDEFTIRYVNPNIMSLYGYFLEKYPEIAKFGLKDNESEGEDSTNSEIAPLKKSA